MTPRGRRAPKWRAHVLRCRRVVIRVGEEQAGQSPVSPSGPGGAHTWRSDHKNRPAGGSTDCAPNLEKKTGATTNKLLGATPNIMLHEEVTAVAHESPTGCWLDFDVAFGAPFDGPWGITLLPEGELCVVERGSQGRPPVLRIVRSPAEATGDDLDCYVLPLPPGDIDDLQGVCVCAGVKTDELLVVDLSNHCVHRLEWPSGLPVLPAIGHATKARGCDDEEALHYPRAVAILEQQAVDQREQRALRAAGCEPAGPALPERLICVADAGNGRVQTFDAASLAHVRCIGRPAAEPGSGIIVNGELEQPLGLCAHFGELYVVDGYRHRVSVFGGASGRFVRSIGGAGELTSPFACLVVRGMLVVSEATRLLLYTLDGARRAAVELPGAQNCAGLCASAEQLYVSDFSRGCVYRLRIGWADEGNRWEVD